MTALSSVDKTTTLIYAPSPFLRPLGPSVFLAGSIDQGTAIEWQSWLVDALAANWKHSSASHLTILNPRRPGWDASWVQEMGAQPFTEQVEWELDAQEASSVIAMYFGVNSAAPISLLELGLFARSGKMVVCCPLGFYRRGNVQIVCARFGIKLVDSLEELRDAVVQKLEEGLEK